MLFDINDFDETLPGPWEWDVKRLAASFEVMGRDRGFAPGGPPCGRHGRGRRVPGPDAPGRRDGDPGRVVRAPRGPGCCSRWSAKRFDVKRVSKEEARLISRWWPRHRTRDSTRVLAKRAEEIDGELRIVADPPIIIPIEDLVQPGRSGRTRPRSSRSCSAPTGARSGAITTRSRSTATSTRRTRWWEWAASGPAATSCCCWAATSDDPLFLQIKEAQASVLERFLGKSTYPAPRRAGSSGAAADAGRDRHFPGLAAHQGARRRNPRLLRARNSRTGKAARTSTAFSCREPPCTPASAGRPSPGRTPGGETGSPSPPTSARGMPSTGRSRTSPSAYADQNERDYAAFTAAVGSGRLVAKTGV